MLLPPGTPVLALLSLRLAEKAHRGAQLLVIDADAREMRLEGGALLSRGRYHEMLGSDVVRSRHIRFLGRPLKERTRTSRQRQVADNGAGTAFFDRSLKLVAKLQGVDLQASHGLEAYAFAVLDNGEEDMLREHLVGMRTLRLFLSENGKYALGAMG
jgi:hypothetical protein